MGHELLIIGALALAAGLLARLGRRIGLPTIPFFMAAGILLGPYTPGPVLTENTESVQLLAAIGLVLLLFQLGVDFPTEQVLSSGRRLLAAGGAYLALNVGGGLAFGFILGWGTPEALVIAGAVGISSSAIVTKLLTELRRLANAETPMILGIIVIEDIFLAFYLALLAPFLSGADSAGAALLGFAQGFGFLVALLLVARFGARVIAAVVGSEEDELLTVLFLGLALLVAGSAEELGVSEAIGALMAGLILSRTILKERVERLVSPLRDAFAAVFFVSFGLSIDVGAFGQVAVAALAAVCLSIVLNATAGLLATRIYGFNPRAAANVGLTVLGRGEFSLILATLAAGAGLDGRIGPFVALYVLILAFVAPLLASRAGYFVRLLPNRIVGGGYEYVEEKTMTAGCTHVSQIKDGIGFNTEGCEECLKTGDTWVRLRVCQSCGHVGCCDDSKNRHATAHFQESDHPIVTPYEEGESWRYCYVDERLV